MSVNIVPKNLAKGVDLCAADNHYYIIRSDLTCYMRSSNFKTGEDLEVFSLHPSWRGADHYVARNNNFYVIRGNYFHLVKNMTTDVDTRMYTIHPNCQRGDHYLSASGYFYIIYQSRDVYRETKNLNTDVEGRELALNPDCKNGLYYFGNGNCCFIKSVEQGEVQYVECKDLATNENSETTSFHPSVTNFLPGGLGVTMGPAYSELVLVKNVKNISQVPYAFTRKFNRKTGYEKEKLSSIEQNWKVSDTVSVETGGLAILIAKSHFSLTDEYGGIKVDTEKEAWTEVAEIEDTMFIYLEPHHELCISILQLGLGEKPVLYCRDLTVLYIRRPPVHFAYPLV